MGNLILLPARTAFAVLCTEIITEHTAELTIRRSLLTRTLTTGAVDNSRWVREVDFFIDQIVEPQLDGMPELPGLLEAVRTLIDAATVHYLSSRICFHLEQVHAPYEELVSNSLRDLGWQTQLIQFSNDDQSDIIAQMRHIQVLIHCRRYSSSIGMLALENSQQRQLTSGAAHAVIVSDGTFSDRARRLASSRSIGLLHHNHLMQMEERLLGTDTWRQIPPRTGKAIGVNASCIPEERVERQRPSLRALDRAFSH